MKEGIIVGTVKGNSEWNCSAPHGAGRICSREEVKNRFTVNQYRKEMKGIYSSCISSSTLEEAPFAYRTLDEITEVLSETVTIKGDQKWPSAPEDRDVLYFLAQSFRVKLIRELPKNKNSLRKDGQYLVHRSKALIKELAGINMEIAQMLLSKEGDEVLPDWFMMEIVRDLPRLMNA